MENRTEAKLVGLRTVIYAAPDLIGTREWYSRALGCAPYFDEPYYVGFNVGGFELGLDPNVPIADGSTMTYWGVADMETSLHHFLTLGAAIHAGIQDVGEGIKTAAVRDPFGNVLGLIENPHFSM